MVPSAMSRLTLRPTNRRVPRPGAIGGSPENYRTAVEGIERYLVYFGPVDGDSAASVFEDLADLFERAAADGTPIRDIVGEDPVDPGAACAGS